MRSIVLGPRQQRGYLESLARTIEGVGSSSQHSRFGDNDVYQHAVSCSLSAIARFGSLVPLLRLVNVTVNSCSVPVDQAVLERVVGLALELETIEVELLRLYQSQVAATDADGRNQGAGFALGERSAHLGSEALVEAAAQRLHDRGLVDVDGPAGADRTRSTDDLAAFPPGYRRQLSRHLSTRHSGADMRVYYDRDADIGIIKAKRVAIVG